MVKAVDTKGGLDMIKSQLGTPVDECSSFEGGRMEHEGVPVVEFCDEHALEGWLVKNHLNSKGIWVRLYKVKSGVPSIDFMSLLKLGLCYGWSESKRHPLDDISYLQLFTPRRTKGTVSTRNRRLVEELITEGKMRPAGLKALGMEQE